MSLVDHAKRSSGGETGPVVGTTQPVQVVAEKQIRSRAAVHEPVGNDGRGVADRHAHLFLGVLQNVQVCVVAPDEELEVKGDGNVAAEDGRELLEFRLRCLLQFILKETNEEELEG